MTPWSWGGSGDWHGVFKEIARNSHCWGTADCWSGSVVSFKLSYVRSVYKDTDDLLVNSIRARMYLKY